MIFDPVGNRTLRKSAGDQLLFQAEPGWKDHWQGMPRFVMGDARPVYQVSLNFLTTEDLEEFSRATGIPLTEKSDSAWYPPQAPAAGDLLYTGPKMGSRYPVCIPSKGRAAYQTTGRQLDQLGVPHLFFVEETEWEAYCAAVGEEKVIRLPFHDLGQGSIPARNFIWEWAKERGHKRHWVLDDNLEPFRRLTDNRRIRVRGGGIFRAMEDFVDRYENIGLAGPHLDKFASDRDPKLGPYTLNSRVYSCILVDTSLTHRWRGRYNEDTDLSLRVLKDGLCTVLFNALLAKKEGTAGCAKDNAMPGGNTDHVYNTGDHRKAFAESLREQHPDLVRVVWKFNRWHHQVDYGPFKGNRLRLRPGISPPPGVNDYGMTLVRERPDGSYEVLRQAE